MERAKKIGTIVMSLTLAVGCVQGTGRDLSVVKAYEFSPVNEEQQELWERLEPEQKAGYTPYIEPFPNEECTVAMDEFVKIVDIGRARMEYRVTNAEFYPSIEATGYEEEEFLLSERGLAEIEMSEGETGILIVTLEATMLEPPEIAWKQEENLREHVNIMDNNNLICGEERNSGPILMDADDDDKWERGEQDYYYFYCEDETPTVIKLGYAVDKDQLEDEMYLVFTGSLSTYVFLSLDQIETQK